MFKKLFILLLLFFISSIYCRKDSTGPEPEPEGPWGWAKVFEIGYSTSLCSVRQTYDGGFVAVGSDGYQSVLLIKTDSEGDTLWTKVFDGYAHGSDRGASVSITQDGGYIIVGRTEDSQGGYGVWLLRTDSNGDTLWTKTYAGSSDEVGNCVQVTMDGGFIIVGYTESYGAGNRDVYLIKTDAGGGSLWSRTYGGADLDCGNSVAQTTDGGYIVAGVTESFSTSNDLYLIKTDGDGDTLWTRTYSYNSTSEDFGVSVQQTNDKGYIVVGHTNTYSGNGNDVYIIKTDSLGDTLWNKIYGSSSYDWGCSVQKTTDGGFIIAGETRSYGTSGTGDVWLIKTDNNGNSQWTWTYSTQISNDRGLEVQQTTDGGFIVAGFGEYGGSRTKGILIRKY